MKKFIAIFVCLVCVMSSYADKSYYEFPINKKGECTYTGTITNKNTQQENYTKARNWCYNQGFSSLSIIEDNASKSFTMSVGYIITNKYVPFAGAFVENLIFELQIVAKNHQISYTFKNLQIQEVYGGWSVNNKINTIKGKIDVVEQAKKEIERANNDSSLSKKERKNIIKENKDTVEDGEETLEKAYKEFKKKLDNFIITLQ